MEKDALLRNLFLRSFRPSVTHGIPKLDDRHFWK